ncbi:MAG: energy transducer TonB, partial [Vulcanimicrobiaceae bacterium]
MISLLLHFVVASVLRWPYTHVQPKPDVVTVNIVSVQKARPTPMPVRTVRPTTAPKAVAKKRSSPSVHGRNPVASAGPRAVAATPTPAPQPSPSANPCGVATASAALLSAPTPPPIPANVRASLASGISVIKVTIDPQGHVLATTIVRSSGSTALDALALQMAKDATYAPARQACRTIAGSYEFSAKFV